MNNTTKLAYVYPILILLITCTLFSAWVHILGRTWILYMIGCLASIAIVPEYFNTKYFVWILVSGIAIFIYYITGGQYSNYSEISNVAMEICSMIFPVAILYYCFESKDLYVSKSIIIAVYILLMITALGTIMAEKSFPGAVRYAVERISTGKGGDAITDASFRMGMCDYALPHALPIIIPPLVYGFKNRKGAKFARFALLLMFVATIAIIVMSGATTPLLLAAGIFLFAIFTNPIDIAKSKHNIIVILFIIVLFFLFKNVISQLLINIANALGPDGYALSISERLNEVGNFLLTGESDGDLEYRMDLYENTSDAISSSFLFGGGQVGGHSGVLDRIGALGIVGFIPWLVALILPLKYSYSRIPKETRFFFWEGVFAGFVMMVAKNMANGTTILFMVLILPLMLIVNTK